MWVEFIWIGCGGEKVAFPAFLIKIVSDLSLRDPNAGTIEGLVSETLLWSTF